MSLHPQPMTPVPEQTARVAHAAFPKGHPSLTLRDHLGTIFQDEDCATLFPAWGYPGLPPWRLALVTLMQFRENLADRQAAEAVRARIDWQLSLSRLSLPGLRRQETPKLPTCLSHPFWRKANNFRGLFVCWLSYVATIK